MNKPSQEAIVRVLLDARPQTLAHELGIPVESGSSTAVFRLLCASALFNVRISPETAIAAFRSITARGWSDPQRLMRSTLRERITALEEADYILFDENISGARHLGEIAEAVVYRFNGDILNLRRQAGHDRDKEQDLLTEFAGVGDAEAGIFLREVQTAWDEVYPYLDITSVNGARRLGISDGAEELARGVSREEFPRLAVALGQVELTRGERQVLEKAASVAVV